MKPGSKKFRALQKTWYQKLADAGFPELAQSGFEDLKNEYLVQKPAKTFEPEKIEYTQRYYELASQLLHTFPFTSKESKSIWRRHSLGWSEKEIARDLGISLRVVKKCIATISSHITNI